MPKRWIAFIVILMAGCHQNKGDEKKPDKGQAKNTGTVQGSCWLTKANGSSDILRGLPITLLPEKIAAKHTFEPCKTRIAAWNWLSTRVISTERESECRTAIASLNRWFQKPPDEYVKTEDAISLLVSTSRDSKNALSQLENYSTAMSLSSLIQNNAIKGRSDVNAKFKIDNVPFGDYVLFAEMNMPNSWIVWILPVKVANDSVSVDCFNDNALITQW